ncbi:hypothetical protein [Wolbachia endosymbiont (group A) of Pogonocherus hispidulus]
MSGCHPSSLFLVIRVAPFLSSQCPDTGMTAVLRHTAIHSYVIPPRYLLT